MTTRPRPLTDVFVPVLLCMGGLLYIATSVSQLAGAFGKSTTPVATSPQPASPAAIAAREP